MISLVEIVRPNAYRTAFVVSLLMTGGCESKTSSETGAEESSASSGSAEASASASDEGESSSSDSSSSEAGDGDGDSGEVDSGESGSEEAGQPNCGDDTCLQDEFCDWAVNSCGTVDWDEGSCQPRPQGCDDDYTPVCACDGEVYSNMCEANAVGLDVAEKGECTSPKGLFACGTGFCDAKTSYCQLAVSDVGGEPNYWSCLPLPDACPDPADCECLAQVGCGDMCNATLDGGLQVTCPGG